MTRLGNVPKRRDWPLFLSLYQKDIRHSAFQRKCDMRVIFATFLPTPKDAQKLWSLLTTGWNLIQFSVSTCSLLGSSGAGPEGAGPQHLTDIQLSGYQCRMNKSKALLPGLGGLVAGGGGAGPASSRRPSRSKT